MKSQQYINAGYSAKKHFRRFAWLLMLVADSGLLLWGAMAALFPEHLLGPGSSPILPAEYEGFTGNTWSSLNGSPGTAGFITLLFRMYGTFNVAFALMAIFIAIKPYRAGENWAWWSLFIGNSIAFISAMAFDRIVGAIGMFEWSEYLGLAAIFTALAMTVPFDKMQANSESLTIKPG